MLKQKINLLIGLIACMLSAQAQTKGFRYRSELRGITNNWHSLQIPNAVFSHAQRGLNDLRIYGIKGKDTIEVPYILEQSANQIIDKEINFKIINQSSTANEFYYTFQAETIAIINQIKLSFKQKNFDWKISLEGSADNHNWFNILKDYRILDIENNNTDYQFTQLNFPDSKYNYYRLSIKADKQPELNAAKILKTDTLKGIDKDVPYQSYHLVNDPKNKETIIEVALKTAAPLSYLNLGVQSDFDFYRAVSIEYASDSVTTGKGIQYDYAPLFTGTISSLESAVFRFNGTLASRLKITIQNNDNPPLRLKSIALKGPIYELIARFEKTDYQYGLYYGNKEIGAPVYELKNFENKIPLGLSELTVGNVQNNPSFSVKLKKPLFENKAWLWAVMGIIISFLGFFTYKMLKENN